MRENMDAPLIWHWMKWAEGIFWAVAGESHQNLIVHPGLALSSLLPPDWMDRNRSKLIKTGI